MKYFNSLLLLLCVQLSIAQSTFFETLSKHGSDAVYQEFYSVYKDDDGKQKVSGKRYQIKFYAQDFNGITSGIQVNKIEDGKEKHLDVFDVTKEEQYQLIGYPNTSLLMHKRDKWAYVAVDDFVFKVSGLNSDNTSFRTIEKVFVKIGQENGKKKKKKGGFFKKLGQAALKTKGIDTKNIPSGPEYKKAADTDLYKLITDYLSTMKAKQNNYTLTAKDQQDLGALSNGTAAYYGKVKSKNDAYWNSEEGQRVRKNMDYNDKNNKTNTVTLKNETGATIYIADGDHRQPTELSKGLSTRWDCNKNAYLYRKGSNSYEFTNVKVYSAKNNCGGTFSIK